MHETATCSDVPHPCMQDCSRDVSMRVRSSSDLNDQDPELADLATALLFQASHMPPSASAPQLSETSGQQSSLSSDVHQLITAEDFKHRTPAIQLKNLMALLTQVCLWFKVLAYSPCLSFRTVVVCPSLTSCCLCLTGQ